jgi:hypothetical protein
VTRAMLGTTGLVVTIEESLFVGLTFVLGRRSWMMVDI